MRYLSQRFAMPYKECMAVLTDIGTEELAHARYTLRTKAGRKLRHAREDFKRKAVWANTHAAR